MTIIFFIILLSLIIIIHELGHLITAKIFNIYCSEFSIGMGPKIFSHQFKETTFSLRAVPIGGYVAMAGDSDNALEEKTDVEVPLERTLKGVAIWKRVVVMLAGIMMNILLAIIVIALVFLHNGYYVKSPDTTITSVLADSPAERGGLKDNDKIVKIAYDNGISTTPKTFDDMATFLATYDGFGYITYTVERGEETLDVKVVPEYNETEGRYMIGINGGMIVPIPVTLTNCIPCALDYAAYVVRTIIMSLSQIVRGFGLNNLSGPLGVYNATDQALRMGWDTYWLMLAILSLNVGIFNALPIPILDGGRVVLVIIEGIIGHPLSQRSESFLMALSLILILGLFMVATFQDLLRIF